MDELLHATFPPLRTCTCQHKICAPAERKSRTPVVRAVVTGDGDDHVAFAPNFIDKAGGVLQAVTQAAMMNTPRADHRAQRSVEAIKWPLPESRFRLVLPALGSSRGSHRS